MKKYITLIWHKIIIFEDKKLGYYKYRGNNKGILK